MKSPAKIIIALSKKPKPTKGTRFCIAGMRDRWFDGKVPDAGNAMSDFATFVGGVYNVGFGYPTNADGAGRRAGMVNFKVDTDKADQSPYFTGDWAGTRNDF